MASAKPIIVPKTGGANRVMAPSAPMVESAPMSSASSVTWAIRAVLTPARTGVCQSVAKMCVLFVIPVTTVIVMV
jgi:hypothetical protein